jgi:RNA polymerase sigma factor (sigma-70 family)
MISKPSDAVDLTSIDSVVLVALCAARQEDSELWSEFLRRFTPKIKAFIRATLRHALGASADLGGPAASLDTNHESDLLQNTILRLVQNRCAALKRFSGRTESELLAYLAVIARSAVRDFNRRRSARRRFHWLGRVPSGYAETGETPEYVREATVRDPVEREILAHEVEQLSLQTIQNNSGEPDRDKLIFQLYFFDGLSTSQIAACKGVGLSKTGVEKILNRLKDRVRSAANVHSIEARS